MIRLLVVAPNQSFRNSLRFALEAEGYDITVVASPTDITVPPSSFDCTVLDHHALERAAPEVAEAILKFKPFILLANSEDHPMASQSFRTLTKPFLGPTLSDAVRAALTARVAT